MAPPVWMVFALAAYLTADASPVRVHSLRGRLPLLYKPRATGSPVVVETWRQVIPSCLTPFATRGLSRSPSGCYSNARGRNTIWLSSIGFFLIFIYLFIFTFFFRFYKTWSIIFIMNIGDGSRTSGAMETMTTHSLRWSRACDGMMQYGYSMSILYKIS